MRNATLNTTEVNIEILRRAINQSAAAGVAEEKLTGARECLKDIQKVASQAIVERASAPLDSSIEAAVRSATVVHIRSLHVAIDRAVTANLLEEQLAAARRSLADVQQAGARTALTRARRVLDATRAPDGSRRSVGANWVAANGREKGIEAWQRAIDAATAAGVPKEELDEEKEAVEQAKKAPFLAALEHAMDILAMCVKNDGTDALSANVRNLQKAIDQGAIASLPEEILVAGRKAVREAPKTAATLALRRARESVDRLIASPRDDLDRSAPEMDTLRHAIDRGAAVCVDEAELQAARAVIQEAHRIVASTALQQALTIMGEAVSGDTEGMETHIEALREAISDGMAADVAEEQVVVARETLGIAERAHASASLQRARENLHSMIRSADSRHVDVGSEISSLQESIRHGVAVGLSEDQLDVARELLTGRGGVHSAFAGSFRSRQSRWRRGSALGSCTRDFEGGTEVGCKGAASARTERHVQCGEGC